jgi:hypothetical protein
MGFFARVNRVLDTHLWGVPRGARLDPALFPEAEYPVLCPRCAYDLHGLPDSRCPECGQGFERGRLLIDQYVRGRLPRRHPRRRLALRLWIVGIVLVNVPWLCIAALCVALQISGAALPGFLLSASLIWIKGYLLLGGLGGAPLMLAAAWLELKALPPRAKRRAVRNALRAARGGAGRH